jgi:hypothetical protein
MVYGAGEDHCRKIGGHLSEGLKINMVTVCPLPVRRYGIQR